MSKVAVAKRVPLLEQKRTLPGAGAQWPRSRNLYQGPVRSSLSSMETAGAAALITTFVWKTVTARRTDPQRALAATSIRAFQTLRGPKDRETTMTESMSRRRAFTLLGMSAMAVPMLMLTDCASNIERRQERRASRRERRYARRTYRHQRREERRY